ncbi:MAG: EAL domain-containing protein, partial [Faecalibacterium sp.]|nr:EAL domain-containing protein [Faecalibacterium sp.]
QAFNRVCTELFAEPERMGVAALMMMDLDNLKHINDTYGHDWGDQYIRRTGQCLRDNTPAGTVCARLSGDEFLVLFHGYRSRDAVREKIDRLTNAMQQSVALLPSGNALHISLSGGIAWYPDDGQDWETLKKYADFAMYQVKHAEKGRVQEFDIGVYNREAYAERTRREFRQLLSNAQVFYCFQPIFSARSGKVAAYEALMRSDLPTLRSPATIMKLAREQGALYEIERITFTKALETFDSLCRAGSVSGDAMLFVNSIASTCLTQADVDYIDSRWRELRRRMVIEITEEEEIDYEALERKRNAPGFSGMFALDDYGSGYSNENTLLQLAPRFVKVDITIIRGIDTSPDKQQILRNVAAYAHPRSMKIVAEGVETAAELRTVIELGADLLQGYFLARPAIVLGAIAPEAAAIIGKLQRRKKD